MIKSKFFSSISLCVLLFAFFMTGIVNAQDRFGGLALYTVRNEMSKNPVETLEKVAEAGYAYVEAANYSKGKFYGMSPSEFNAELNKLSLMPLSAHQGGVTLENADTMIADTKAAGFQYFVVPIPPMGMFKYDREAGKMGMEGSVERLAEILQILGKKCKEAGIKLLYHNHDFEFMADENGIVVIDYLLENLDPEYVNFQMDLFWVTKAGADPFAYFEKYPGRFKIWHVKDMDDQGRFAPVGKGTIDFGKILEKKSESGMKYYMVEQDRTFDGMKPLDVIKISHDGIRNFGFN